MFLMIDNPKKNWTVYLLECGDQSLYCGITNDLDNRLKQHRGEIPGGAKYTRSRSPLKLVYREKMWLKKRGAKKRADYKKIDEKR
jgi:putative endonuclease